MTRGYHSKSTKPGLMVDSKNMSIERLLKDNLDL